MKISHKIENINGSDQLVMYVEYPAEYEFSLDFDSIKKNVANVSEKIRDYAMKNIGKVTDNTVLLILNGVVVGTLMVSQLVSPSVEAKDTKSKTEIVSTIEPGEDSQKKTGSALEEQSQIDNKDVKEIAENQSIHPPLQEEQIPQQVAHLKTEQEQQPVQNSPAIAGKSVSLKLNSGEIIQIGLEDYVYGVVSAEMPAEFSIEALKAQAVAARTYALKRVEAGSTLVASSADQNYKTDTELKSQWGGAYAKYSQKVRSAVQATAGESMTYRGKYIDALYFSISNGKTEDAMYVWGNSVSYLKSVSSPWDKGLKNFQYTTNIPLTTASSKLGINLTSSTTIQVREKTTGDRVKSVAIGDKVLSGVQVRNKLGLRSADFDMKIQGDQLSITTRGFGHGVGMSQYGANEMAKLGNRYQNILTHYYTGINIIK